MQEKQTYIYTRGGKLLTNNRPIVDRSK